MDLLHRMKMADAKPALTSCTTCGKLSKFLGEPLDDPIEYRTMVGALQYLTLLRPDLSYSVNQLCQFLRCPKTTHLIAAKQVLRYIKGFINFVLNFSKVFIQINGFCDSDWARNQDDKSLHSDTISILDHV